MKKFIKKVLSFIIVFSVVSSMIIPIHSEAAAINSLPWSKNFDDMADATYSAWLGSTSSDIDAIFNGSATSVLSIENDTDSSHEKVLHIDVDPTSSKWI